MCGIVGYTGAEKAAPLLLEGLERLEYRGYDSAGIAVFEGEELRCEKECGRLSALRRKLGETKELSGCTGIGHTRWATHGEPSDLNAHPHMSAGGKFCIVHNGIIENFAQLREELEGEGTRFVSDTDTEVAAQLLERLYDGDPISTLLRAAKLMEGSYALGVLCSDFPEELFCIKNASPLLTGVTKGGRFIASDMSALENEGEIYRFEDGEAARITKNSVAFFNSNGDRIEKQPLAAESAYSRSEKGEYEHFMLKEIYEQPEVLRRTLSGRFDSEGHVSLPELRGIIEAGEIKRIYIVACGSAYHAGAVGKYVFEELLRIPCEVDIASEFRYRNPVCGADSLVLVISQSGETADTLAALQEAQKRGARTLSIVNVRGSTIAAKSGAVIYTEAGPEVAVATTKAYSAQLMVIYMIAAALAKAFGSAGGERIAEFEKALKTLPQRVEETLACAGEFERMAQKYRLCDAVYFIGRGLDYACAMEASLKLKEISYLHSEAYPAGELKHGTISLIDEGTPVIALAAGGELFKKTVSNCKEVKARGARVLCVCQRGGAQAAQADDYIFLPPVHPLLLTTVEVIPMQIFAYFTAKLRGCDIDKPRNLAKSVTVE